ncbi:MAG: hypothetical protein HY903_00090 [Deltaproteobacteria bacterium]|nr:hypothetical protein [Deltaproteobacteria bacterium]
MEVVCDTGLGVFSGVVTDMSESGVFMQTDRTLRPGTMVTLIPNVTEEMQLPAELKAQVIRVTELNFDVSGQSVKVPGIALRLVGLTVTNFSQVRGYLNRHGQRRADVSRKKAKPA